MARLEQAVRQGEPRDARPDDDHPHDFTIDAVAGFYTGLIPMVLVGCK